MKKAQSKPQTSTPPAKNITANSCNTQLLDRTLWFDGDSTYAADRLITLISKYDVKYVDRITDEVAQYNKNVSRDKEFKVKEGCNPLEYDWKVPEPFRTIDVKEYVLERLVETSDHLENTEVLSRGRRVIHEIELYEKYNLINLLRAIIYVINTLTETNSVWGVGRGSSVSSYVLYLIGVHDVDSYAYGLDIEDFLHD